MELNNLIIENQNMIYKITHYFEKYASKEDLFQVGCIGLIKAYKKYDESYGAKFTTYAYPYILGEIRKYVREDKGLKISRKRRQDESGSFNHDRWRVRGTWY